MARTICYRTGCDNAILRMGRHVTNKRYCSKDCQRIQHRQNLIDAEIRSDKWQERRLPISDETRAILKGVALKAAQKRLGTLAARKND